MMLTKEQIEVLGKVIITRKLSTRAREALIKRNILTYKDLAECTDQLILSWKNAGKRTVFEFEKLLSENGLSLGMTFPTEREVQIAKGGCLCLYAGGYVFCHARMYNDRQIECQDDCTAFAIQNGCAICKMMHGDQIIGKLIEKGTE